MFQLYRVANVTSTLIFQVQFGIHGKTLNNNFILHCTVVINYSKVDFTKLFSNSYYYNVTDEFLKVIFKNRMVLVFKKLPPFC